MATANGLEDISSQSTRFFQIVNTEELIDHCEGYPSQLIDPHSPKWPFSVVRPFRLLFEILKEPGNFHRVQWNKQKVCLSPRFIGDPLAKPKLNKASFVSRNVISSLSYKLNSFSFSTCLLLLDNRFVLHEPDSTNAKRNNWSKGGGWRYLPPSGSTRIK